MKNKTNILWGLIFIILGVILGSNALGLTDINIFFNGWWTLFIIVPSFMGLINDHEKTGNLIGLIIGVLLLLSCQNLFSFKLLFKLIPPLVLVIIGLSLLFKDTFNREISREIYKLNKNVKNDEGYAATFSNQDVDMSNEEFKGTTLNAIFGGVKLDLTESKIKNDVVINATSIFGGIKILAPNDVKVKVKSNALFGGVSNERKNTKDSKNVTIYVNATCLFGGVEIK